MNKTKEFINSSSSMMMIVNATDHDYHACGSSSDNSIDGNREAANMTMMIIDNDNLTSTISSSKVMQRKEAVVASTLPPSHMTIVDKVVNNTPYSISSSPGRDFASLSTLSQAGCVYDEINEDDIDNKKESRKKTKLFHSTLNDTGNDMTPLGSTPRGNKLLRQRNRDSLFISSNNQLQQQIQTQMQQIYASNDPFPLRRSHSIDRVYQHSEILEVHEGMIFEMRKQEQHYHPADNISRQPFITPHMRATLFDWLADVAQEFVLKRQTVHFAFNYIDRYLSKAVDPPVRRSQFQLVGITALWIASKVEEIFPPRIRDFAASTDGAFSTQDILSFEKEMAVYLDWRLLPVTCYSWTCTFLRYIFSLMPQLLGNESNDANTINNISSQIIVTIDGKQADTSPRAMQPINDGTFSMVSLNPPVFWKPYRSAQSSRVGSPERNHEPITSPTSAEVQTIFNISNSSLNARGDIFNQKSSVQVQFNSQQELETPKYATSPESIESRLSICSSPVLPPAAATTNTWITPGYISFDAFSRIMEIIDHVLLYPESLDFLPSEISACAIFYYFSDKSVPGEFVYYCLLLVNFKLTFLSRIVDFIERVTRYRRLELEECMEWIELAGSLESNPKPMSRIEIIEQIIPECDRYTIQRHHPHSMMLFKSTHDLARHEIENEHHIQADDDSLGYADENIDEYDENIDNHNYASDLGEESHKGTRHGDTGAIDASPSGEKSLGEAILSMSNLPKIASSISLIQAEAILYADETLDF